MHFDTKSTPSLSHSSDRLFPDDANDIRSWTNRADELLQKDRSNGFTAVFPRTYHQYLVVPAPPEGTEG